MLIFGLRSVRAKLATLLLACPNGHTAAHSVMRITRMLSLFFIPLIPVRRSYFVVCTQCGLQTRWEKDAVDQALARESATPTERPTAVD